MMKAHASRTLRHQSYTPSPSAWAPSLNLAETEFRTVVEGLEERLVHHCDRPEIEGRILDFIAHAQGPTTEGIAAEMGISPEAAGMHLAQLQKARHIWGQTVRGDRRAWYVSQRGKSFLGEKVYWGR